MLIIDAYRHLEGTFCESLITTALYYYRLPENPLAFAVQSLSNPTTRLLFRAFSILREPLFSGNRRCGREEF